MLASGDQFVGSMMIAVKLLRPSVSMHKINRMDCIYNSHIAIAVGYYILQSNSGSSSSKVTDPNGLFILFEAVCLWKIINRDVFPLQNDCHHAWLPVGPSSGLS